MKKVIIFLMLAVTAIIAQDTTTVVNETTGYNWINAIILAITTGVAMFKVMGNKLNKILSTLSQIQTQAKYFFEGIQLFLKKYNHVLREDIQRDFVEMVLKPGDSLLELMADKADTVGLKKLAKELRDVIKTEKK